VGLTRCHPASERAAEPPTGRPGMLADLRRAGRAGQAGLPGARPARLAGR
jgi:hypothetical protein